MRQELLEENNLEQTLAELERLANELKGKQLIGSSSIKFHESTAPGTYDFSGVLPQSTQVASAGTKILRVTATAQNMDTLYGDIIVYMYVNGVRYRWSDFLAAITNGVPNFYLNVYNLPVEIDQKNTINVIVVISGDKVTPVAAKVYVTATDTVDITITEMN